MQNRYVGDVGDFGKYGLLRFIASETKLKLGVNWYLTSPTEKEKKSGDGKFYGYLLPGTKYESERKVSKNYAPKRKKCDEKLYEELQKIIIDWLDSGKNPDYRCVEKIEDGKILPDQTVFYSRFLNKTNRKEWQKNGIQSLSESELIFLDPDNGFADNDIFLKDEDKSPKHVYFDEIKDYFENGQSLVIYQHANHSRKFNDVLNDKKKLMKKLQKIHDNQIICLRYKGGQARAFFIIMQQKHSYSIEKAVHDFLELWKGYFERTF